MTKSWLYRWFGLGKVPLQARPALEAEGIVMEEEGLSGTMTVLNLKAPGHYAGQKKKWFIGALVLTRKSFRGYAFSQTVIELPMPITLGDRARFILEGDDCLRVDFKISDFRQDASGDAILRFRTPVARRLLEAVRPDAIPV